MSTFIVISLGRDTRPIPVRFRRAVRAKLAPMGGTFYSRHKGGSVNEEIVLLLALQEKDQQRSDLTSQVENLNAQKEQIKRKIERERSEVGTLGERLEELKHESRLKNHEVDELDIQIHDYRKELEERIISYKEMESLRVKIANQSERIDGMENAALSLMDQIEETTVRLNKAKEDISVREEKLNADCAGIVDHITQVKEGIEKVERERAEIAAKIPSHLLKRYEHLHTKFSDPIVTINDGACSGCKLTVSGTTMGRVRGGLEIVSCENCSRILYIR